MNYSKSFRREAIAKRVILTWVMVAIIACVIGMGVGYALKTHITAIQTVENEQPINEQVQEETLVYGAYDDRCFTEEVSLDWGVGDLDFIPLDVSLDVDIQEFVYYLSAGYNIDFTLVMALMQHESSFRSDVVSNTDDYGLMQINSCNHEQLAETLGITDFLDPHQNIRAGTFTLRKLFERYQDTNMVLMAYNMGEDGASRLWKKGIYNTNYTDSILIIQQQFNAELEGDADAGKLEGY